MYARLEQAWFDIVSVGISCDTEHPDSTCNLVYAHVKSFVTCSEIDQRCGCRWVKVSLEHGGLNTSRLSLA